MSFSESYVVPKDAMQQLLSNCAPPPRAESVEERPVLARGLTARSRLAKYNYEGEDFTKKFADRREDPLESDADKREPKVQKREDAFESMVNYFPPHLRHHVYGLLQFIKEKVSDKIQWDPKTFQVRINNVVYANSNLVEILKFYYGEGLDGKYLSEYKPVDFDFAAKEDLARELDKLSFPKGAHAFLIWLERKLPEGVDTAQHFNFKPRSLALAEQFNENILKNQTMWMSTQTEDPVEIEAFVIPDDDEPPAPALGKWGTYRARPKFLGKKQRVKPHEVPRKSTNILKREVLPVIEQLRDYMLVKEEKKQREERFPKRERTETEFYQVSPVGRRTAAMAPKVPAVERPGPKARTIAGAKKQPLPKK